MSISTNTFLASALFALEPLSSYFKGVSLEHYLDDDFCQSSIQEQLEVPIQALIELRENDSEIFTQIPEAERLIKLRTTSARGGAEGHSCDVYNMAATRSPVIVQGLRQIISELQQDGRSIAPPAAGPVLAESSSAVRETPTVHCQSE